MGRADGGRETAARSKIASRRTHVAVIPGSGLGLWIANTFIAANGPGLGTIRLPANGR
jgi:hypothetical protein